MNTDIFRVARGMFPAFWTVWLGVVVALAAVPACAETPEPLFPPPEARPATDEILMISTRTVGLTCEAEELAEGICCQRYEVGADGVPHWVDHDWHTLATDVTMPTYIYVHGNRVSLGQDGLEGLAMYRSLKVRGRPEAPIRFVIWSWPSSALRRPIKDYLVKAHHTVPVAWQLAWVLNQMPGDTPLSLVGYSYGARVISGTLHLLGGGSLGELRLETEKLQPRAPVRAALMAAAFDEDWLLPGKTFEKTIDLTERVVLVTNHRDPAMKYYHLSNGRRHVDALGKKGLPQLRMLGVAARKIQQLDVTETVGRSHALGDYLASTGTMTSLWRQLDHGVVAAEQLPASLARREANPQP